jgi:hypothetical protein
MRAAFHKIRIAKGHEHLTAFQTQFSLFKWLVCPFGLTRAPASFQRYINSALSETLGLYATAYLDDVLIFSAGSRLDYIEKVHRVLTLLRKARLNLDLKKSAFAVKEVQYLRYIIEAGKAIQPDLEKLQAVME